MAALVCVGLGSSVALAQRVGAPIPTFQLSDSAGAIITPATYAGRPWVLNVWATWCRPCRAELPLLERVADAGEATALAVVLLNAGEPRSVADRFLTAEGIGLGTLADADDGPDPGVDKTNDVMRGLQAIGLPASYFIDADGVVRAVHIGELTPAVMTRNLRSIGMDWRP